MRHPVETYNQSQADTLAQLPEAERAFWARLFRLGNATYCYQRQFDEVAGLQAAIEPNDLAEWLDQQLAGQSSSASAHEVLALYFEEYLVSLPHEGFRQAERAGGLEAAKGSWPFRRYVLERNDFGLDAFMRLNLSAADYAYFQSTKSLPE